MAAISSTFDNIYFSLNWDQVEMEKTRRRIRGEEDKNVMGLQKKKHKQRMNPMVDN